MFSDFEFSDDENGIYKIYNIKNVSFNRLINIDFEIHFFIRLFLFFRKTGILIF